VLSGSKIREPRSGASTGLDLVRREILPNGLRVVVRELRGAPVVALNLWVGTGSSDDPEDFAGLAHFTEHMLFRPGRAPGAVDLARMTQDAGGYLNAETGCDHTVYYQVVPPGRWADVLAAGGEAIGDPAFDAVDVDAERSVIVDEARGSEADPASFLWRRLMETVFLNHPCRRPVVGTEATLAGIDPDHLRDHHRRHYVPANMVQVIVGDVDAGRAIQAADESLGGIPARGFTRTQYRETEPAEIRARCFTGPWEQASVGMAFLAPPILHGDIPALDVACGLLGIGRSSRLRKSLQTGGGLVVDVRSGVVAYRDVGIVSIGAGVVGTDVDRVIESVFVELERMRAEPVSGSELEKMLRRLEAGYVLEHETSASIAGGLGLFETAGDYHHFEEYVDRLAAVTPGDVFRVARDYLDPRKASVVTYVPDTAGVCPGDRSGEVGALAERARRRAPARVAERASAWGPARAFERPMILAERGASGCECERLPEGPMLIRSEARALPIVSVAAAFCGGFREEPQGLGGATYLTQRLSLRGTKALTADEVADAIEGLGSAISTATDRDGFGFGMTVLADHLREGVDILGRVLTEPGLPAEQLERVRAEVLTEIKQLEDHPMRRATLLALPLAFPDHPYGRPLRGTEASVGSMTSADVMEWHAGTFNSDDLIVVAVGDLDRKAVRGWVQEVAARLPSRGVAASSTGLVHDPSGRRDVVHAGSVHSTVALVLRGPSAGTRDEVVMRVICRACSMMGGRLWMALRERPPFAYAVGCSLISLREGGAVFAHATAPTGQEEAALDALDSEFLRLAADGLSRAELERAKRHLGGVLAVSMERSAARAAAYAMAETTGAGSDQVDRMPGLIRGVTNDDVAGVAADYLGAGRGRATVVVRGRPAE
jgi:zinc protease